MMFACSIKTSRRKRSPLLSNQRCRHCRVVWERFNRPTIFLGISRRRRARVIIGIILGFILNALLVGPMASSKRYCRIQNLRYLAGVSVSASGVPFRNRRNQSLEEKFVIILLISSFWHCKWRRPIGVLRQTHISTLQNALKGSHRNQGLAVPTETRKLMALGVGP